MTTPAAQTSATADRDADAHAGSDRGAARRTPTTRRLRRRRPKPEPPLLNGGKVTKLEFTEGDTVKFRVVSPVAEEVRVHGYNIAKDLEPNKEITVSFPATIEGIFEIEYEHAGEQIGELRVEPNQAYRDGMSRSYASGVASQPLLGETIGENLAAPSSGSRTARRSSSATRTCGSPTRSSTSG